MTTRLEQLSEVAMDAAAGPRSDPCHAPRSHPVYDQPAKGQKQMSGSRAAQPKSAPKPRADVGYKRPPVEHRFQKGQSGNPNGRPRKAGKTRGDSYPDTSEMLMNEVYGAVDVVENGVRTTMPAIMAIAVRLKVAALKGDNVAARRLLTTMRIVERQESEAARKTIAGLADYKAQWARKIEQCLDDGEPEPDPVPHPDEIVIDSRTGQIIFNGPVDEFEKAEWDQAERDRLEPQYLIEHFEREIENPERGYHISFAISIVQDATENLARINRKYPPADQRRQPGFNLEKHRAEKDEAPHALPTKESARPKGKNKR